MRYLKYFEASGWTDFISRLSDDQFKRRVANKKFIDLSQKEQSAIIDMLKPKIFSEDVSLSFNIRMTKDGQKMSRISYRNYDMMIYKEEKDDWYYVLSGRDLFNPNLIPSFHPLYLSRNGLVTKRLECDQFDGLLRMISEFLEFIQNKKNESIFNQRMGDKLWVEFDSTHEPFETSTGHIAGSWQFNSMKDFRKYHKRITPTQAQIDSVIELLKSSIDGINNVKYYSEWRQIYCNMWDDEKQYTYAENEKLNKIKIIIDFYDEDWYFVALCDENTRWGETETHFACDDFDGLKQWLSDHKTIIENKK